MLLNTVYRNGFIFVTNLLIGGAKVVRQTINSPAGKRFRMDRTGTPLTSGFFGLSYMKSYHSTPPPGFTSDHIFSANFPWKLSFNMEENTVD